MSSYFSRPVRNRSYMGFRTYLKLLWKGGLLFNLELLSRFPRDWFQSRRVHHFVLGLPFIAVGGLLCFLIFIERPEFQKTVQAGYQKRATEAYEAENFSAAKLYFERAANFGNSDARYGLARCLERTEGSAAAAPLMQEMAADPMSQDDLRPHFWLIQYYANQPELERDERIEKVRGHLEQVLEIDPKNYEASQLLTNVLMNAGEVPEAISLLEAQVSRHPEVLVKLGAIYEARDETVRLESTIERGLERYRDLVEEMPGNLNHLAMYSQFLVKDEQHQKALRVLEESQQHISEEDRERLNELVVRCLVAWYASVKDRPNALKLKLEIAQQLVNLNPKHPDVLVILAELMEFEEELAEGEELQTKVLKEALAEGTAPQMVHFILGSHAYEKQDLEAAERHWDLAFAKSGRLTPILLNNLAMVYAERREPDLDRALELINQALEIAPNSVEFRDTRGQIHAAMKNWKGAILDLQLVVRKYPERQRALEIITKAYEELGDAEMASAYRKRVNELKGQEAPKNSK